MRKLIQLMAMLTGLGCLAGCEAFDRFEAWKMEAVFGVPNPYNAQPMYGNPYGPSQPMYANAPPQGYAPQQPVYSQQQPIAPQQPVYSQQQPLYAQPQPMYAAAPGQFYAPPGAYYLPGQQVPPGYVAVIPQGAVQPGMQPMQPVAQPMVQQVVQPIQPVQQVQPVVQPIIQQVVPTVAPVASQPQALLPPSSF